MRIFQLILLLSALCLLSSSSALAQACDQPTDPVVWQGTVTLSKCIQFDHGINPNSSLTIMPGTRIIWTGSDDWMIVYNVGLNTTALKIQGTAENPIVVERQAGSSRPTFFYGWLYTLVDKVSWIVLKDMNIGFGLFKGGPRSSQDILFEDIRFEGVTTAFKMNDNTHPYRLVLRRARIFGYQTVVELRNSLLIENSVIARPDPFVVSRITLFPQGGNPGTEDWKELILRHNTFVGNGPAGSTGFFVEILHPTNKVRFVGNIIHGFDRFFDVKANFHPAGLYLANNNVSAVNCAVHSLGEGKCYDDVLTVNPNTSVTPMFVDADTLDFRLAPGSSPLFFDVVDPSDADTLSSDIDGRPRVRFHDLGALETIVLGSADIPQFPRGFKAVNLTISGYNLPLSPTELSLLFDDTSDTRLSPNPISAGTVSGKPTDKLHSLTVNFDIGTDAALGLRNGKLDGLPIDRLFEVVNRPPQIQQLPNPMSCVAGQPCEAELTICDPDGTTPTVEVVAQLLAVSIDGLSDEGNCTFLLKLTGKLADAGKSAVLQVKVDDGLVSVKASFPLTLLANAAPSAPTLTAPPEVDGVRRTDSGTVSFTNSVDATPVPGKPTTYRCEFSTSAAFDDTLIKVESISEHPSGSTRCTPSGLVEDQTYYVRVIAIDGVDGSLTATSSQTFMIRYDTKNGAPSAPTPLSPGDGSILDGALTLTATNSTDPDGDELSYEFLLALDSGLTQLVARVNDVDEGSKTTSLMLSTLVLQPGTTYYWAVRATDDRGQSSNLSAVFSFTTASVPDGDLLAGDADTSDLVSIDDSTADTGDSSLPDTLSPDGGDDLDTPPDVTASDSADLSVSDIAQPDTAQSNDLGGDQDAGDNTDKSQTDAPDPPDRQINKPDQADNGSPDQSVDSNSSTDTAGHDVTKGGGGCNSAPSGTPAPIVLLLLVIAALLRRTSTRSQTT